MHEEQKKGGRLAAAKGGGRSVDEEREKLREPLKKA